MESVSPIGFFLLMVGASALSAQSADTTRNGTTALESAATGGYYDKLRYRSEYNPYASYGSYKGYEGYEKKPEAYEKKPEAYEKKYEPYREPEYGYSGYATQSCYGRPPGLTGNAAYDCKSFSICQSDGRLDIMDCPAYTRFNNYLAVCDWPDKVDAYCNPLYKEEYEKPKYEKYEKPYEKPYYAPEGKAYEKPAESYEKRYSYPSYETKAYGYKSQYEYPQSYGYKGYYPNYGYSGYSKKY